MSTTITNKTSFDSFEFLQFPFPVTLSSNQTAQEKFRYILKVYINGTTSSELEITIKQQANANGDANIDVFKVLESYVSPKYVDGSNNPIHEISAAEDGGNAVAFCRVECDEEYAASATENPQPKSAGESEDFIYLNTVKQFVDGLFPSTNAYQIKTGSTGSILALTSAPTEQKIATNEYATMAFVNTDFDSRSIDLKLQIVFYDASGTQTGSTQTLDIVSDLGGDAPRTSITSTNPQEYIQFIPVGYANLVDYGLTFPNDTASYTVQVGDATTSLGWTTYEFTLTDYCRYTPRRLAWLNEFGAWDYYTFELVSIERLNNIQRKSIRKPFGTWSGTSYSYLQHERGQKIYNIEADKEFTVRSNWLNDDEFVWLERLLMSKEVFLYLDGIWQPVNLTDSNYEVKRSESEKLNNLEISFTLANKIR